MDEDTYRLIVEADSYLTLLYNNYLNPLSTDPMLKYEVESLISRLRLAEKRARNDSRTERPPE